MSSSSSRRSSSSTSRSSCGSSISNSSSSSSSSRVVGVAVVVVVVVVVRVRVVVVVVVVIVVVVVEVVVVAVVLVVGISRSSPFGIRYYANGLRREPLSPELARGREGAIYSSIDVCISISPRYLTLPPPRYQVLRQRASARASLSRAGAWKGGRDRRALLGLFFPPETEARAIAVGREPSSCARVCGEYYCCCSG